MSQNQEHFTVDTLLERAAIKLSVSVQELHQDTTESVMAAFLEVICEEINSIRKELRRKI